MCLGFEDPKAEEHRRPRKARYIRGQHPQHGFQCLLGQHRVLSLCGRLCSHRLQRQLCCRGNQLVLLQQQTLLGAILRQTDTQTVWGFRFVITVLSSRINTENMNSWKRRIVWLVDSSKLYHFPETKKKGASKSNEMEKTKSRVRGMQEDCR